MDYKTHETTNHSTIEHWVSNREGKPVRLREESKEPGLRPITIFFPKQDRPLYNLEEISWNEFFDFFEEKGLSFLYKDNEADGGVSHYFKMKNRS
jgi:hypothetical protein